MSTLKLGLNGLSPEELVNKAQILVEKMTRNKYFPLPIPSISVLAARKDILADFISKASKEDPKSMERVTQSYENLFSIVLQLGGYVSRIAKGNDEIILSSGFETRNLNHKTTLPEYPENFKVNVSNQHGAMRLEWQKVVGQYAYVIQMTSTDPVSNNAVWVTVGVTSRNELNIQNLKQGVKYYFRIKTVGKLFESPYSRVATIIAA